MMRCLSFIICTVIILVIVSYATATSVAIYPIYSEGFWKTLNGQWSFKYAPGPEAKSDEDFFVPNFDTSTWKLIPVPANWELHGFAEMTYDRVDDGTGLYRRTFRCPETWSGRRVIIRFEGVAYGYDVWVNSTNVGSSSGSAYNPHEFDITDAIQTNPDAENTLAVRVTNHPLGYQFDQNDDW